jgi:hypothetical protein
MEDIDFSSSLIFRSMLLEKSSNAGHRDGGQGCHYYTPGYRLEK